MASTSSDNAFGHCRCCLKKGYHKDISEPYYRNGVREVYREMFLDCFNLLLSMNTKLTNLICTSCIRQLNDSMEFRAMVAESEQQLLSVIHSNKIVSSNGQELIVHSELDIKVELEEVKNEPRECSMDYDDADSDNVSKKNESSDQKGEYITVDVPSVPDDLNNYIPKKRDKTKVKCHTTRNRNSKTDFSKIKSNKCDEVINNELIDTKDNVCQVNIAQDKKNITLLDSSKEYSRTSRKYTLLKPHSSPKNFSCDSCPYIATKKIGLIRHLRNHTGETSFTCETCDKTFTKRRNLKTHVRLHTGEKPYVCEICDKKFTKLTNLKTHRRVHTGEHPYACEICGKMFTKNINLKRHVRIHTGEKPYTCEICEKKFTQSVGLNKHVRIHTGEQPYTCEICNKKFANRGNLKTHLRVHTGEKPYACEICDKMFTNGSNLKAHVRTHTGEQPYACEICDKKFTKNSSLKKHVRIHTTSTEPSLSL